MLIVESIQVESLNMRSSSCRVVSVECSEREEGDDSVDDSVSDSVDDSSP